MLSAGMGHIMVPTGDERGWGYQLIVDRTRINRVLENHAPRAHYVHDEGRILEHVDFSVEAFGSLGLSPSQELNRSTARS